MDTPFLSVCRLFAFQKERERGFLGIPHGERVIVGAVVRVVLEHGERLVPCLLLEKLRVEAARHVGGEEVPPRVEDVFPRLPAAHAELLERVAETVNQDVGVYRLAGLRRVEDERVHAVIEGRRAREGAEVLDDAREGELHVPRLAVLR